MANAPAATFSPLLAESVRVVIVRTATSWYSEQVKSYPVSLIGLDEHRVLVIGGGSVALRKIEGLLQAGARPHVIALRAQPEIAALASEGRVTLDERAYRPGDCEGAWLVVAGTSDAEANYAAAQEALAAGALVNAVDDPAHSNIILPAVVRRGEVTVAVSTGGGSPALARRLREDLESLIGEEVGELAHLLAELRPELIECCPPGARLAAALRVVDDAEIRELLAAGEQDGARERARSLFLLHDNNGPFRSSG